ncbi:hypothetical protein AYO22_05216 [Fonsecaea multimorphosa]|nr:hypothetical protein AYO22_05216 [Fonsecaea multimorphosa]
MEQVKSEIRPPVPTYPIEDLPGTLPLAQVDQNVDHEAAAVSLLKDLEHLNADSLADNAMWRDACSMTGTLRTFNGPEQIVSVWRKLYAERRPHEFQIIIGSSKVVQMGDGYSWVQAKFSFKTAGPPATLSQGQIGIVPDPTSTSGWRIWLITTVLEQLQGRPGPDQLQVDPVTRPEMNGGPDGQFLECVIIGAGFAGLCLAGRLKAMGINHVIIERNARIGDNWINRYESCTCDLPFGRIFTDGDYPYYLGSKDLARGFQEYVDKFHLVCYAGQLPNLSLLSVELS